MTHYIYDIHGTAVGFIHDRYIHDMHGHPVGQLEGTHVYKLSGTYVGELHIDMVLKKHFDFGNIDRAGNIGIAVHPDHPAIRGPVNYGYPDAFAELLK